MSEDTKKPENYGIERRRSYRLPVKISLRFTEQNKQQKAETKNISRYGFLFESQNKFAVGSILLMDMELPRKFSPNPIPVIVKVVRASELPGEKFDIGVEIIKISTADLNRVIKFIIFQQGEQGQDV